MFLFRFQHSAAIVFNALSATRKIMQTQPLRNFYGNDTELETVLPPQCGVVNVMNLLFQPCFNPVLENEWTTWKNKG